jgi:hypothetical protein
MIVNQPDFSQILVSLSRRNWTAEEKSLIRSNLLIRVRILQLVEDDETGFDWAGNNYEFAVNLQNELPLEILEEFIKEESPRNSNYIPPSPDNPIQF